jgi:hypothetical protein
MKALAKSKPVRIYRPPTSTLQKLLYNMVTSPVFEAVITLAIAFNIGLMACDYWGIEQDVQTFRHYHEAMDAFTYIFYVEALLKITGLGIGNYFTDPWCQFDFFLVATSLLNEFSNVLPLPPMLLRALRILRILRILRLLKGAKELRKLIVTMVLSFPSLLNVSSLLALVVFIYSVLGLSLFT